MGRLGKSNTNTNTNTNTVFSSSQAGVASGVRYNSQEFTKVLQPLEFPAELPATATKKDRDDYTAAEEASKKIRFRKNWDPELRASVYLNEFIVKNPDWLDKMITALNKKHKQLQDNNGEQLRA